jgi:hypothetical protein
MRASGQASIVALVVGLLLLSYPLVNVPNQPVLVLGVPLLYLYLFGLWLVGIAAAWLLSRSDA